MNHGTVNRFNVIRKRNTMQSGDNMNIQNKDNLLLLKEVQDVLNEHDHVELACKIGRLMLDLESFIAEKGP